jgi:hypothetical protein
MHFTSIITLAGLAAAAPSGLVYRHTNETVPAYKVSRSIQGLNETVPAYKASRSILNETVPAYKVSRSPLNDTVPAYKGVKLVSRSSAHNFNTTGLSVTPSS